MKTNEAQKVILPDSPEAAIQVEIKAWQSTNGQIWLDESVARYTSSTHRICKRGHITPKGGACEMCAPLDLKDKYQSFRTEHWDGEPLYSYVTDKFYFDDVDVISLLKESGKTAQDLMLVFCEPKYAYGVDPDDYYQEHLPDGIDVPEAISRAFNDLNNTIDVCGEPLCYYPKDLAAIINQGGGDAI